MARRPIIVPRHKPHSLRSQPYLPTHGGGSTASQSGGELTHPLALLNANASSGEAGPEPQRTIGIRRHGRPASSSNAGSSDSNGNNNRSNSKVSTPEKKPKKASTRKRQSPTSVRAPLDFIREEEDEDADDCDEEENEEDSLHNCEALTDTGIIELTLSQTSSSSDDEDGDLFGNLDLDGDRDGDGDDRKDNTRGHADVDADRPRNNSLRFLSRLDSDEDDFFAGFPGDEDEDLSRAFGASVMGSTIDQVNESDLAFESFDGDGLVPRDNYNGNGNGNGDDETDAVDDVEEEHLASLLTGSSSILTTLTLEQSREKQQHSRVWLDLPTPPTPAEESLSWASPEEQRRVMLLRYRYNQIHHMRSRFKPQKPSTPSRALPRGSNKENEATSNFCPSEKSREEYEYEEEHEYEDDHSDFHLFEDAHGDDDDEDEEPYQHTPQQVQEHRHKHQHDHVHIRRPRPTALPGVDPIDPFARLAETVRSEHETALNARSKASEDALRWSGELEEASETVRSLQAKLAAARIHERDCARRLQTAEDSLLDRTETAELSALHLRLVTERIVPNPRARKLILAGGLSLCDNSSSSSSNGKCMTSGEIDCETNSVAGTSLGVIRLGSRRAQNLRENTNKGASAPKGNKHEPGTDRNRHHHHHLGLAKNKLSRIVDLFDQVERFRRDDKRAQILLETAASKYVSYQREAQEHQNHHHHHQQQRQQHC